ncbi:amidohydrolase [Aurantiacibacter gilvus]|uniref:Amidohydrolase n=1 Tax=Aurantiacibacter gilvus TaxID=3139141 RepID=A0ABU9IFA5_9SPHN
MIPRSFLLACTASALATSLPTPAHAQLGGGEVAAPSADTILVNGEIRMDETWAEAMVLRDGVILAMGDEATVRAIAAPGARVIDLAGRTVLPGLHDMHVHPLSGGMAAMQCQVNPDSTIDEALQAVQACVAEKLPGEWITGRAYEPAALGVTPTREMLDSVAPDNPVLLTDVSIHSSWANSLALEMAGIDRDTPDPEGGIIERDRNGDPTGVLRESASQLVARLVPPPTREQNAQALGSALDYILSFGITSFEDALVSGTVAQAYADLADSRELLPYVRGCVIGGDQALIASRQVYARDRFSPSCVKLITDGVPTDSHTAAMLDAYADTHAGHAERSDRGMLFVESESLDRQLIRYDAMGLTVKLHAAGDAAVRQSLDAIEAAREANGQTGILHNVSHNSFVATEDLARAAEIDAVLEFSPYIWFPSPIVTGITQAIGEERMERFIPVREAIDAGAFTVVGSDWNVVPSINPWLAIETLVTRRAPGATDGPQVGGSEAITVEEAFDMFTINAARHMHRSDVVGTLEPGKIADLIVLDRNIFEVPIETVHQTQVLGTMLAGKFVTGDPDFRAAD